MAGETVKSEAICLSISPWSMTSHVVNWLTPAGIVPTVVKGAARPKSAFLGQYDLNYTCEIVYYARARGELHALRECSALERRDELRDDYRSLAAAGYLRLLASRLSPQGPECAAWHGLLSDALDRLCECSAGRVDVAAAVRDRRLAAVMAFELESLHLLGLAPEVEAESGAFAVRGERRLPVSPEAARFIRAVYASPRRPPPVPLDALRVVGVYYNLHVGCASEVRRCVMKLLQT
ncbi:MAG: DNA repair protein RecO C-terminal domain-containing protein [Kiritimatiellae bacterium]|nr:DNA repair protein RecO C-terminal domain-containing protein [Kiritimatiellia bacterium]